MNSIATEAGLLEAINAQATRIEEATNGGARITHDEIRLIAFLASEVRRRIETLSSEQREEFDRVRSEARHREISLSVDELEEAIEAFVQSIKNPKSVITFSTVSELEMRAANLYQVLGKSPEAYAKFLDRVQQSLNRLEEIKNSGIAGFQSFD